MLYIQQRFCENRAVCEIKGKNVVEPERLQMRSTTSRMRFACWIINAILVELYETQPLFHGKKWFRELASRLLYVHYLCC